MLPRSPRSRQFVFAAATIAVATLPVLAIAALMVSGSR